MAPSLTIRFFPVLLLLGIMPAVAQPPRYVPKSQSLAPRIAGIAESAQPRISRAAPIAHKGSGIASRLIAFGNSMVGGGGGFMPSDSMNLIYAHGRGGDLTEANPLYYDTLYWQILDPASSSFIPEYRQVQFFNQQNQPIVNSLQYYNGTGWGASIYEETWSYNTAGHDSVFTQSNWNGALWHMFRHETISYDGAGKVIEKLIGSIDPVSGAWQATGRHTYTYNAAGSVTTELVDSWDAIAASWVVYSKSEYAYTADNLLERYTELWGPALDSTFSRWYFYNSARHNIAYRSHHHAFNEDDSVDISALSPLGKPVVMTIYMSSGNWEPYSRYTTTYTATEQVASETTETYSGGQFNNLNRFSCAYNSFDQLILEDNESFFNGDWGHSYFSDPINRYHYGVDGAGIPPRNGMAITISPVPAHDQLRFSLGEAGPAAFSATILSSDGRIIRSWNGNSGHQADLQVDTQLLPAGNYVLSLSSNGRRGSAAFSVIH